MWQKIPAQTLSDVTHVLGKACPKLKSFQPGIIGLWELKTLLL